MIFASDWSIATRLKATLKHAVRRWVWKLDVGAGTKVHPTALLDRTWPVGLHIGCDCRIDAHVVVLTHDFTRGLLADTRIGDRCSLGSRALVMPGVTIGDDCHVAPGAIVTRDMPPGSRALGNPAAITPIPADARPTIRAGA